MSRRVREALASGSELEIGDAAREAGFSSITDQAVELALAGRVAVHEVYRSCYFGGE